MSCKLYKIDGEELDMSLDAVVAANNEEEACKLLSDWDSIEDIKLISDSSIYDTPNIIVEQTF